MFGYIFFILFLKQKKSYIEYRNSTSFVYLKVFLNLNKKISLPQVFEILKTF